jgi:hypothetical protein
MAITWWQRLKRKSQPTISDRRPAPPASTTQFEYWDLPPNEWRVRTETAPVKIGLVATAKVLPAIMTGYTYDFADSERPQILRGTGRLALLNKWASVAQPRS